jgi:hypothetical protein
MIMRNLFLAGRADVVIVTKYALIANAKYPEFIFAI